MHHASAITRRGSAAIGLVLVLAMLSLAVIGFVLAGARDQDMTVSRLDTLRAMYAAEGGAEMAIREIMTNVDQDGDGAIGSISNDGNSANDPNIGGARVYVTRSASGSNTTLDVRGSTSVARRRMQITVAGASGASQAAVIYGEDPSQTPVRRTWNGTSWSSEAGTLNVGGGPRWIIAQPCPARSNETAAVVLDSVRDINAMIYDGTNWGNLVEFTTGAGTAGDRPVSLAYEQSSGDLLVVYRIGSPSTIYYRTWNGTSWSAQQSTSNPASGSLRFLKLIPKPGSDQIILLALDDNKDLVAMVWDGAAWGNKVTLDTNVATWSEECMDAAFESNSGDGVIAWGRAGTNNLHYRTFTSGGWSGDITGPDVGAPARWVRLNNDPASDRIMMITLDDSYDVNVALWGGSNWGAATELETNASTYTRRDVAVCFEPAGTRAIAMYGEGTLTTPRYRVFDGTNWSGELTGPDLGDDYAAFQLARYGSGQNIFALALHKSTTDALHFLRWNGTSFVDVVQLEANVAGSDTHEAFSFVMRSTSTPVITNITAVAP